jgi:ribonuclease Z
LTLSRSSQKGLNMNRTIVNLRRPTLLAFLLIALFSAANVLAQGRPAPRILDPEAGLSAILLGTGVPIPNPDRATACTAVIAGDRVFLVDTGRNCVVPMDQAGIRDIAGVFYTHYHSDHFIGLGEILLNFGIDGIDRSIPIRGPAGAKEVVDGIVAAYRLDLDYRITHHGEKFSNKIMQPTVTEHEPGVVYDEQGLKVTMFPVCHQPIEPAVGYRFEFQDKVLVVSGDTNVCPEFAEGARGADLLISEVENAQIFSGALAVARSTNNTRQLEMIQEGMEYHAESLALARMAQEVGVKKLALTHLFPSIPPTDQAEAQFIRGMSDLYDGPIIVGRDGTEVSL